MAIRFRKSIKMGPARVNLSSRGVGWSVGGKGLRVGYYPSKSKKRTTGTKKHSTGSSSTTAESSGSVWGGIKIIARWLFIVLAITSIAKAFPHSASWAALFAIILVLPIAPLRKLLAYVFPTFARRALLFWLGWMTFYMDGDVRILAFSWAVSVVWTAAWAFVSFRRRKNSKAEEQQPFSLPGDGPAAGPTD